jgi:hypothetical protein
MLILIKNLNNHKIINNDNDNQHLIFLFNLNIMHN